MNQPVYRAPVEDWAFILTELLRVQERPDLPGFESLSTSDIKELLGEAARFHEEVLLPLAAPGDREGARLVDGGVVTPAGFPQAWEHYRAAGWPFVSVPEDLGGGGMPPIFAAVVSEMRMSTAHSFAMYGAFCYAASTMIAALGAGWMRQHIAVPIASGEWTATMCLTEAGAGSDLRHITTRAIRQSEGGWKIYGEKVFISGGDHDLTNNIVHVVLAKIQDDAGDIHPDLHSIGVFIVPKINIDQVTGDLGAPNAVVVRSIEHKMGIEGSATCTMSFDGATGWQVTDEEASGLAATMGPMFFLMNKARVSTANSGVAYAELAYQNAAHYARNRLAGRAPGETNYPELSSDPIIAHPDIRRLLLGSRAFAEGARALALQVSLLQSEAEALDSSSAQDLVELLTPVMKAYFTDKGFESANNCLQVLGGYGYIRDFGLEQMVRNARVGQIYEGANGIQARDAMRMLTDAKRDFSTPFMMRIEESMASAQPASKEFAAPVRAAMAALRDATLCAKDLPPAGRAAVAYDLMTAYGILAVAWTWLDLVSAAERAGDATTLELKRVLAGVWMQTELPLVHALAARVTNGGTAVLTLDDALI